MTRKFTIIAIVGIGIDLCAGLMLAAPAQASPPAPGSEDYDQLMPFADWIVAQHTNNPNAPYGCCSISDCRVVPYRAAATGYEAFLAEKDDRGFSKFPGAPNAWEPVPASVIKHEANPTGRAIACWSNAHVDDHGYYCFFLPDLS